jgi:chaperonin GroES
MWTAKNFKCDFNHLSGFHTNLSSGPAARENSGDSDMKVRPLNDRVLVKRVEEADKTAGGLFIPDSAKEKPQRGKVLAVGSGRYENGQRVALDVKKGDEVLFGKYGGSEITVDGEDLLILKEDDILGVLQ